MIKIFCKGNHPDDNSNNSSNLCNMCHDMEKYIHNRIDYCKQNNFFCAYCDNKCHPMDKSDYLKKIMRYSGPRILKKYPIMSIKHFLKKYVYKNREKQH